MLGVILVKTCDSRQVISKSVEKYIPIAFKKNQNRSAPLNTCLSGELLKLEVSCKRSMQGSPRVPTSPKGSAQSLSQLGPMAQWGRLRKRGQRAFSVNIKVTCWLISVVDCYWELALLPEENSPRPGSTSYRLNFH